MPETLNITGALRTAAGSLGKAGVIEARREANSLLSLALKKDLAFLFAHPEYTLTESEQKLFDEYLRRRVAREPFQHIAGHQEFYGLDFIVTPDVLIPRPETELLVETAIELFKDKDDLLFCEIGVGSGCISIAILHHLKNARAIGFDISQKALGIAEKNAFKNNVAERLELGISDVFSAADSTPQFDLIVSNPPYISIADFKDLQAEVRDYEPSLALTDDKDGLSIVETLIRRSPGHLKPGGYLLIEIGIAQSSAVREMVDPNLWQALEILPDLQGIHRMVKLALISRSADGSSA
jgi:release factor glutamine methyltransferase